MNIYTPEGWINIPHIDAVADRNGINFIIIIGKRQVGKTYGVCKYMLDMDKRFIFMRRVKPELQMLTRNVNSPFEAIHGYEGKVLFQSESEYTAGIFRLDQENEEEIKIRIGLGTTLNSCGKIRGASFRQYSDWVFDEFIPEEHLFQVHNEGDAFLNAHTTINGNRELEGEKCIRTWLLANSNNLNSGILEALKLTRIVERMSVRGEETRILPDRGVMIILPESKAVIAKRKQGGLMKALGGTESKFARMAYENEFSYNDYTDVFPQPLGEYNPYITIGRITIHLHKNDKRLYITDKIKGAKYNLSDSDTDIMKFNRSFSAVRIAYMDGRTIFQDMTVKNYFLDLIK